MQKLSYAWDVISNNDPELSPRENDAIKRALKALDEAAFNLLPDSLAVIKRDGAGYSDLPCPRLQLRWDKCGDICHYELVMELTEFDIRRERNGEVRSRFIAVPMGCTTRYPGGSPRSEAGVIDTPYRDGVHIRWDMKHLNLPGYALWEGHAYALPEFSHD